MAIALLLGALLAVASAGPPAAALTVSAAISLTEPLEEIAAAYAKRGGGLVRLNLGASNALARQILNGAPADLFISADEAQMDLVDRAGGIVAGSRLALVGNRLAVVASGARAGFVRDSFWKAPPEIRRVAIGDPAAVPAGVYARAFLERRGLWRAYASRIVPTPSVRSALAAVENGAADVAIVYATDVHAARLARVVFLVEGPDAPRIVYPAAVVAASRRRAEAGRFLQYLGGEEAAAVFMRYGFTRPSK